MSVFDYGDPIIIKKRSGDSQDPYQYYDESYLVINNKVVLKELPDQFQGVTVTNYYFVKSSTPASNEFTCDFTNGILTFNSSENNKTVQVQYWGTGVVYWPSSRIYLEVSDQGEVTETLQDAEDTRKSNETIRQENEQIRISQENDRQTAINNFKHKGTYSDLTNYQPNNIVDYQDSSYMCIQESTGNLPTDTNFWKPIADLTAIQQAEADRVNAENTRQSNENTRISNENTRISQENDRQTAINNLDHKGDYSDLTTYELRNMVTFQNSTYMCIQESTGNLPTDTNYWRLIAQSATMNGTTFSGDVTMENANGIIFGGRFKIVYNTTLDSLDFEVI